MTEKKEKISKSHSWNKKDAIIYVGRNGRVERQPDEKIIKF